MIRRFARPYARAAMEVAQSPEKAARLVVVNIARPNLKPRHIAPPPNLPRLYETTIRDFRQSYRHPRSS